MGHSIQILYTWFAPFRDCLHRPHQHHLPSSAQCTWSLYYVPMITALWFTKVMFASKDSTNSLDDRTITQVRNTALDKKLNGIWPYMQHFFIYFNYPCLKLHAFWDFPFICSPKIILRAHKYLNFLLPNHHALSLWTSLCCLRN